MKKILSAAGWVLVILLGAFAYFTLATKRGEAVNSSYILIAAVCSYAIGYRFYSKWIAARVLALNDRRATPCEVHEDGKDFVKTNKWIVFGHHFAAISGPGPLVGPVLAAQFGYLPGTLWILIGVVLGGAVQDFVILFCSMRRNGRSLGQMVRDELGSGAGAIGLIAILSIMIILLAVLALVVVNALAESPWGVFTVSATIPIAMFMGGYLRFWRIGKVMEVSAFGVVLLLLAVWGGQFIHADSIWHERFTFGRETMAWGIICYGLAASILPVWLLLAPRDYLSTFMKLGTIFALALGIFLVLPNLKMPAVTVFSENGQGLVLAGKLFPFCFITIACGAISGFHTLISSGITPKIITREGYARPVGYGSMLLESLVAIMAMIAACTLEPGVYFCMNVKGAAVDTVVAVTNAGFPVTLTEMTQLAATIKEQTLFGRTGGAATLAVGMANIFSQVTKGRWLDLWYHFAIMFEALFILTTLDAGTRVGRYLIQDALGHIWKPLGEIKSAPANVLASALVVAGWGFFLIQGVRDPLGGINSLWPLFGIANQLLASIALCLATTVILKMALRREEANGADEKSAGAGVARAVKSPWAALVTLIPLVWLLAVTMTAGWQKVYDLNPRIGFLAAAKDLDAKLPALQRQADTARVGNDAPALELAGKNLKANRALRFNNVLDAMVARAFLVLVALILLLSVREWILLLGRAKLAFLSESDAVWLPEYAVVEGKPLKLIGLLALALALAKELSGEAAVERAQKIVASDPCCAHPTRAPSDTGTAMGGKAQSVEAYLEVTESRYRGVNRCC